MLLNIFLRMFCEHLNLDKKNHYVLTYNIQTRFKDRRGHGKNAVLQ